MIEDTSEKGFRIGEPHTLDNPVWTTSNVSGPVLSCAKQHLPSGHSYYPLVKFM